MQNDARYKIKNTPPNTAILEGMHSVKRVYKVCIVCIVNYGGIIAYGE